jgi:transcriptional regulator with XRE-family HTH domain
MARIRRAWRQQDLADRAGVSRTMVSRVERGHLGQIPLGVVRATAALLDIRIEVKPRARAIDLDRVVNARHAALAEFATRWLSSISGWTVRPEVSFSEFGERGVIDLLSWHSASRSLLVVELKTELVEFGELLGTLDRKGQLAPEIARRLGWRPASVSTCLLVADSSTNRRRGLEHGSLLRAALPHDSRELLRWLKRPAGEVRALRFVSDVRPGRARASFAAQSRVRTRSAAPPRAQPRSAKGPDMAVKAGLG